MDERDYYRRAQRGLSDHHRGGREQQPKRPNGPERDSNIYTARPTTTGGNPSSVLAITTSTSRPGKRYTASAVPSGAPIAKAHTLAVRLTCKDSRMIARRSASNLTIS